MGLARVALTACTLLFSGSIQAQERGDSLADDDARYVESPDPEPATPRYRQSTEGDDWSGGAQDEPAPRSQAQPRASTPAQAAEPPTGEGRPRVRRRADFDGPDWDKEPIVEAPKRPGEILGSFRFAAQLTLVGYESMTVQSEVSLIPLERQTVTVGLSDTAGAGLAIGFGVSDHVVLNAAIVFAYSSLSFADSATSDQLRFHLLPSIEYVLGEPEAHVRPFLAGVVGLLVGDVPTVQIAFHEISFLFGAQLGLHLFPNEHVSLDPTLMVGYRLGSAAGDLGTGRSEDYGIHGLVVLLAFGASFWS